MSLQPHGGHVPRREARSETVRRERRSPGTRPSTLASVWASRQRRLGARIAGLTAGSRRPSNCRARMRDSADRFSSRTECHARAMIVNEIANPADTGSQPVPDSGCGRIPPPHRFEAGFAIWGRRDTDGPAAGPFASVRHVRRRAPGSREALKGHPSAPSGSVPRLLPKPLARRSSGDSLGLDSARPGRRSSLPSVKESTQGTVGGSVARRPPNRATRSRRNHEPNRCPCRFSHDSHGGWACTRVPCVATSEPPRGIGRAHDLKRSLRQPHDRRPGGCARSDPEYSLRHRRS